MEKFKKTQRIYGASLYSMLTKKNVVAGYLFGAVCVLGTSITYSRVAGNHTVCLAEAGILHYADQGKALLMIIGCIITMFDAPYIDKRSFFLLHRTGRKPWYKGTWLYILTGCTMYFLFLCLLGMLPFVRKGYLENAWSQTMLVLASSGIGFSSEVKLVPPAGSVMDLTPYTALLHTMLGLILYSSCLVGILYVFNMRTNRTVTGTIAVGSVYVISKLLSSWLVFGRDLSKWSLTDNALFAACYNPQTRPLQFTYSLFILILFLLYMVGERILPHVSFVLGEEK